jgi:hypothetical protein
MQESEKLETPREVKVASLEEACADFIIKRQNGEIRLKDEAGTRMTIDYDNNSRPLSDVIADCVTDFRFYVTSHDIVELLRKQNAALAVKIYEESLPKFIQVQKRLAEKIDEARMNNLIEDGCEKQLDLLKKENGELKQELANCKAELGELKNERDLSEQVGFSHHVCIWCSQLLGRSRTVFRRSSWRTAIWGCRAFSRRFRQRAKCH